MKFTRAKHLVVQFPVNIDLVEKKISFLTFIKTYRERRAEMLLLWNVIRRIKNFKSNDIAVCVGKSRLITSEIEWFATRNANVLDLDEGNIAISHYEQHFKICEANLSSVFEGMEGA